MPKKVDECVEELKKQGYSEDEAWAICKDAHESNQEGNEAA